MVVSASDQRLGGIYPMLYALWRSDGGLDVEAMSLQVEHAIASGCHGIAVLGLVTESHRLSVGERLELARKVGALINGRVPYSVSVKGETAAEQVAFAEEAVTSGADWLILQPPSQTALEEGALIDFFADVAGRVECGVGIQNNPEHLLNAFTAGGLQRLRERVPNITVMKAEGPVVAMEPFIVSMGSKVSTFGGHGGIEHIRLMRAGADGLIPAPDCLPLQILIHELWLQGTPSARQQAEAIQNEILPLIVFMNRSIDVLLCYGRQFIAQRLGLKETFDRFGTLEATEFGLSEMALLFAALRRSEERWLS